FKELPPALQQATVALGQEREDQMAWQGDDSAPITLDSWSQAEVAARYVPAGWYAWQPPTASSMPGWYGPTEPYGGKTAEAALAAVRRVYPAASPQDVTHLAMGLFSVGLRFRFPEPLKPGG